MRAFLLVFFFFGLACSVSSLATPAQAEAEKAAPAAEEPGRYGMTPTEGGFLRLDRQSGAVSFCTAKEGVSICRAGADEKAALEAEITRLRRENAELRKAPAGPARGASGLPSEEEFERTLSYTERFLRRILRVFREEASRGESPP